MEAPRAVTPYILEYPMTLSPVKVFEAFEDDPYSFLLESGMNLYHLGRFSFIGSDPFTILKTKGDLISVREGVNERSFRGNPFEVLRTLLGQYRVRGEGIGRFAAIRGWCGRGRIAQGKPAPLLAGAVGFLGYDLNRFIERLPSRSLDDLGLPDCLLGFYDRVVIFDHVKKKLFIASTGLPETEPAPAARRAALRAKEMAERIRALEGRSARQLDARGWMLDAGLSSDPPTSHIQHLTSNFTREEYLEAISRAKEYIAAGDIYQVNLSQRLSADLPVPPFELYKRLRRINPAPFAGFLNFDGVTVVSASPERFLRLKGRMIETRPMKGTRPRGKTPSEDRQLKEELLRSEKEKAELVMIVDLERNDLGRVSEAGSVRVKALRTLEMYATVFQTTATIVGRLREDRDRIDLLKACFPGGSVTGAPKIRAMEIIEELEPTKRGIYTGSIGYLGFDGDMDLNIVIRTFVIKKGKAFFQVGGGIVADSQPEAEYEETMVKARALIETLLR